MKFRILLLVISIVAFGCKKDSDDQLIKDEAKTIKVMSIDAGVVQSSPIGQRDGSIFFSISCDTCKDYYSLEVDANLNSFHLKRIKRGSGGSNAFSFNGHLITSTSLGQQEISDSANSSISGWALAGIRPYDCKEAYYYQTITEYSKKQWENFRFEFVDGLPFSNQISGYKVKQSFTTSNDGSRMLYASYDTIITGLRGVRNAAGVYQDTILPYQSKRNISIYIYNNSGQLIKTIPSLNVNGGMDGLYPDYPEAYEFNSGYYLFVDDRIHVYDKNWSLLNTIEYPATGACYERILEVKPFKNGLNIYSKVSATQNHTAYFSTQLRGVSNLSLVNPSDIYGSSYSIFTYENGEVLTQGSKWSNSGSKIYSTYTESPGSLAYVEGMNIIPSYEGYYMLIHDRRTDGIYIAKSDEKGRIDENW